MRVETYYASVQLVRELDTSSIVRRIINDGGDIIHLELITGEFVMVYLIESHIPVYELKNILETNTRRKTHSLFILWADMLLPTEGGLYEPEDWHHGLMAICGGKIYGYEIYQQRAYLYPVCFEQTSNRRLYHIRYGETINTGSLHGYSVTTRLPGLEGQWFVAGFDGQDYTQHTHTDEDILSGDIVEYFAILQIGATSDREAVKRAYRRLARVHHPDMNDGSATAHKRMQVINHAYQTLMRVLDLDG